MRALRFIAAIFLLGLSFGALGQSLAPVIAAPSGATFTPCTAATLATAITTANANGQNDTINLSSACTYTLTAALPAIINDGGTTMTINGNGAVIDGAGAYRVFNVNGGTVILNGVTVQNARIGGVGRGAGANVDAGYLEINASVFRNNVSATTNDGGGGLGMNGGTVIVSRSLFQNNNATVTAGGAFSIRNGNLTIINSTITGNDANFGGAAVRAFGGTTTITNSTIAGNLSPDAVDRSGGTVSLRQSIFADNDGDGGINFFGVMVSLGYNIVDDGSCAACTATGDQTNTDPLLAAFTTSFYPLPATSPALHSIPSVDCFTPVDQRGTTRPQGTGCDAGAIEMAVTPDGVIIIITEPVTPLNRIDDEDIVAYSMPDNVYGIVLMRNNVWENFIGSVPQALIDNFVIIALEVYNIDGGVFSVAFPEGYRRICLRGSGRFIFMDATQSPRPINEITNTALEDGFTCAWIPNAGAVALIRG